MPDPRATNEIAQHVEYELAMLNYCVALIGRYSRLTVASTQSGIAESPADRAARLNSENLAIEGVLLHARALCDFLESDTNKTKDDVLAVHFVKDPKIWNTIGLLVYLKSNRKRLNKLLAHLTYSRADFIRQGRKAWEIATIQEEVETAWAKFIEHLDNERRSWFQSTEGNPV